MTIAYPLTDLCSLGKGQPLYQAMGHPCIVLAFRGNVAILQNVRGNRFPANKEKLIWSDYGP